jgi:hypothetical protein
MKRKQLRIQEWRGYFCASPNTFPGDFVFDSGRDWSGADNRRALKESSIDMKAGCPFPNSPLDFGSGIMRPGQDLHQQESC